VIEKNRSRPKEKNDNEEDSCNLGYFSTNGCDS
jgi:hypothetical protein